MTNRTKTFIVLVTLLATAAGCGGLTPDSFCQKYATDVFSKFASCQGAPSDTTPDVEAMLGISSGAVCAPMTGAVKGGRAKFDAGKAQDCLSYIEGLSCADIMSSNAPAPCQQAITGTVAAGGTCYSDYDCGPSGFCTSSSSQACPGKCQAYAAAGDSCSGANDQCTSTTYCDGSTCQAYPKQGDACDMSTGGLCANGDYCKVPAQGTAGTCQPLEGAGGACTDSSICELGTQCVSGTCTKYRTVGQSCTADSDCGLFTHCASGTCTEDPRAGGTCGVSGSSQIGCINAYCKLASTQDQTGTCTAFIADGKACDPVTPSASCGTLASCSNGNVCTSYTSTSCNEP